MKNKIIQEIKDRLSHLEIHEDTIENVLYAYKRIKKEKKDARDQEERLKTMKLLQRAVYELIQEISK